MLPVIQHSAVNLLLSEAFHSDVAIVHCKTHTCNIPNSLQQQWTRHRIISLYHKTLHIQLQYKQYLLKYYLSVNTYRMLLSIAAIQQYDALEYFSAEKFLYQLQIKPWHLPGNHSRALAVVKVTSQVNGNTQFSGSGHPKTISTVKMKSGTIGYVGKQTHITYLVSIGLLGASPHVGETANNFKKSKLRNTVFFEQTYTRHHWTDLVNTISKRMSQGKLHIFGVESTTSQF